ncbi:hypothetical protein SRHO_G00091350 [Serrasalmus rhombeus]
MLSLVSCPLAEPPLCHWRLFDLMTALSSVSITGPPVAQGTVKDQWSPMKADMNEAFCLCGRPRHNSAQNHTPSQWFSPQSHTQLNNVTISKGGGRGGWGGVEVTHLHPKSH